MLNGPYEYEHYTIRDAMFPALLHEDRLLPGYGILTNWHENLELLWFTKGRGLVIIDGVQIEAGPGDIVLVNSNCLHRVLSLEDLAYYCLIIDKNFCLRCGFPAEAVRLRSHIRDGLLRGNFKQIVRLLRKSPPTARLRPRQISCCS